MRRSSLRAKIDSLYDITMTGGSIGPRISMSAVPATTRGSGDSFLAYKVIGASLTSATCSSFGRVFGRSHYRCLPACLPGGAGAGAGAPARLLLLQLPVNAFPSLLLNSVSSSVALVKLTGTSSSREFHFERNQAPVRTAGKKQPTFTRASHRRQRLRCLTGNDICAVK